MVRWLRHQMRSKYVRALLLKKTILHVSHINMKLKSGDKFSARIADKIGQALLNDGSFEEVTRNVILSRISKGMTVLDIGANIGYYTVLMARAVGEGGRVIAFEPNPVVAEELKNNVRINNLANVLVEQVALSNKNGEEDFYCPEFGAEGHGSLKPNRTFSVKTKFRVKVEKIDDALARIDCKDVDFVKIDAEGAEYSIFQGSEYMLSSMKPEIIFECAENLCEAFGHNVFDVLAFLDTKGYRTVQFDYGMWRGIPFHNAETK